MKLCKKSYKHFVDEVFFQGLCELTPIQHFYAKVFILGFTLSTFFNVFRLIFTPSSPF
jgi:hypothetical protein